MRDGAVLGSAAFSCSDASPSLSLSGQGRGRRRGACDLAQGALEHFDRLAARDQVLVVDDDRRHRVDAGIGVEAFALAGFGGVLVAVEDGACALRIEPRFAGQAHQHFRIGGVLAIGVAGLEQRLLERDLPGRVFERGPMQQAMRVEGVVDARAPFPAELETHRGATGADRLAVLGLLLARAAVFFVQVLVGVLAFGRHVGVEFEGLEVEVGGDLWGHALQRGFEGAEADGTPGAGDVGDEVDAEVGGHEGDGGIKKPPSCNRSRGPGKDAVGHGAHEPCGCGPLGC